MYILILPTIEIIYRGHNKSNTVKVEMVDWTILTRYCTFNEMTGMVCMTRYCCFSNSRHFLSLLLAREPITAWNTTYKVSLHSGIQLGSVMNVRSNLRNWTTSLLSVASSSFKRRISCHVSRWFVAKWPLRRKNKWHSCWNTTHVTEFYINSSRTRRKVLPSFEEPPMAIWQHCLARTRRSWTWQYCLTGSRSSW